MTASLSTLIEAGADHGHVAFGVDGAPAPLLALLDRGARAFRSDATAGAVGMMMTNDRVTVELLLGAIANGVTLLSLPLPGRGADLVDYARFLRDAGAAWGVEEIVARDDVADLLDGAGLRARRHSDVTDGSLAGPSGTGFRLIQFSSGSTGAPKPVVMDDRALGANVESILAVLDPHPGDAAVVSWLPLSHDLGLVGMVLTGIAGTGPRWVGDGTVVLLDPTDFLRRPASWIEALSRWRATFTAAPDFGYRMAAQRPPDTAVDLCRLRAAILGGEIVRAETLSSLLDTYGGQGLDPRAICPAYGMAEAGLAVTLTPPGQGWRQRTLSTEALAADCIAAPGNGDATSTLVASGPPVPAFDVRCDVDLGTSGPIGVRGPSLGIDGATGTGYAGADGWYRTGDIGFLDGGWLYVCGRHDDYLVAHGRNIYAPAVEGAVGTLDGLRPGRVCAVGLPTGAWAIVAEAAGHDSLRALEVDRRRNAIRLAVVRTIAVQPDEVHLIGPGSLPMTPSGKLQRKEVGARLLRGELG